MDRNLVSFYERVYSRPIERSTLVIEGGGLSEERWQRLPSQRSLYPPALASGSISGCRAEYSWVYGIC